MLTYAQENLNILQVQTAYTKRVPQNVYLFLSLPVYIVTQNCQM